MKKTLLAFALLFFSANLLQAQTTNSTTEHQTAITKVLQSFMHCMTTKDSTTFYNLFYDGPVAWVGVYQTATQQKRSNSNPGIADHKLSDYKSWFRSIIQGSPKEEKFYNVQINTDGHVAAVTFDFSYWAGGKKGIWGKETWGMVRINNEWKITSVLFSIQQENIVSEPERRQ